jgi:deoxycytidine triphosphate deaminase
MRYYTCIVFRLAAFIDAHFRGNIVFRYVPVVELAYQLRANILICAYR